MYTEQMNRDVRSKFSEVTLKTALLAVSYGLLTVPVSRVYSGPLGEQISGKLKKTNKFSGEIPAENKSLRLRAKSNAVGGALLIRFGEGKQAVTCRIECVDMPNLNHHWGTTAVPKDMKDAALRMDVSGVPTWRRTYRKHYFIRPDIHFYFGEDFERAKKDWSNRKAASQHEFDFQISRRDNELQMWMDGRFFTAVPVDKLWTELSIQPVDSATVSGMYLTATAEDARYVPVDVGLSTTGDLKTESAVNWESQIPLPMIVKPWNGRVDVGRSRWLRQAQDSMSFYSPFAKRSGWDAIPETILFSVPKRYYRRLHLLCAVDSRGGKSPTMAVGLARYRQAWDGTGATQALDNIRIDPNDPRGCESIKRLADVVVQEADGPVTLPLYRVTVSLKTGELADFLERDDWDSNYERTDYFYLEFSREIRVRASRNYGVFERLPLGPQSGVQILGATLEKAPIQVTITSKEPGNIFYVDREPSLELNIANPSQDELGIQVKATFRDFDGATRTVSEELVLKPGDHVHRADLGELKPGWYSADFQFEDRNGATLWEQSITLALLPPDTRKAGAESPFGTWWFPGHHYSESDPDRVMALVQKMGIRHVTPPTHNPKKQHTSAKLAEYQVTPSMMRRIKEGKKKSALLEEQIKDFVRDWPGTNYGMIFHETHLGGLGLELPPELIGKAPLKLGGDDLARYDTLVEHAQRHASAIRKLAPEMKIILGNGSTNFAVHWLRTKLPRKNWDALGLETAIQLFHPESQPTGWNLQSIWIAKRMAEIYGYDDLPVTSCYEYDYRSTAPGALSLEDQANWYARDVLHCLAYRMPNINVALIMDCNSSYYSSRWGSTGVCFRAPKMMPKPGFVALSTVTQELDRAEYQRWLDTGSTGLYCLEFKTPESFVYAIWASRGKRQIELASTKPTGSARVTSLMGRSDTAEWADEKITLTATESPMFIRTAAQLVSARAGLPIHTQSLGKSVVIDPMHHEQWKIVAEGDPAFQNYCAYKPMVQGKFATEKAEQGMQVSLVPQPDIPDLIARYGIFEPSNGPTDIKGHPKRIGVWVNGNSNWGRVYFELIDGKGRKWRSNGWEEGPSSWDMSDWEANMSINFDGWRYVSVGLPSHYASGYHTPDFRHWRCIGDNSTKNRLVFPVKLNRVYVVMREKLVHMTDMVPAKSLSIGLKDLSAELE